jgi:uncharacterized membrane protein
MFVMYYYVERGWNRFHQLKTRLNEALSREQIKGVDL